LGILREHRISADRNHVPVPVSSSIARKATNMKVRMSKYLWAQVACLSLWPIFLFAQSSDLAHNLATCTNGEKTCDRSKLSPSEADAVVLAGHGRNVSDCRNGYDSCDHSKLTEPEAIALAVADH
jgi:hypothetical protein